MNHTKSEWEETDDTEPGQKPKEINGRSSAGFSGAGLKPGHLISSYFYFIAFISFCNGGEASVSVSEERQNLKWKYEQFQKYEPIPTTQK